MLPGQQSCRHNQRRLGTGHCHGKGGSERHFGFAETDVAANQPVHRNPRRQISENVADRIQLIFGFVIGKTGTKFVI